MRSFALFLCFALLLSGCTAPVPETVPTAGEFTQPSTIPETAPATAYTETVPTTAMETEPTVWEFDPRALLQTMTAEEKVGQLFLARCPDVNALEDIATYHLGGYILFGRDFEGQTPESVKATLSSYQSAAKLPMLIAVDEEGGSVTRVSRYSAFRASRFPSPRTAFAQGGMELVLAAEKEKSQLLKSLGINVNMAPVCDITTDSSAFMYGRSLGQSPEITARYISDTVQLMAACEVGSVLKHFPGYGNNTDTHTGIAVDSRSLDELLAADLVPFAAGMEAGCGAILVSHTIVGCMDAALPASLSPAVHDFIRFEMGYNGVIVTDDLVMQAITDLYGDAEAAVMAVLAGNDLLCSSNYPVQYAAVLAAVKDGRIPMEVVDAAVCRVIQWKYDLGLLQLP